MRRSTFAITAIFLGCSMSIAPRGEVLFRGDVLWGRWTDAPTSDFPLTLTANPAGATLSSPCWVAQFGPVPLSDSLTFRSIGVLTQATGVVPLHAGEARTMAGRVRGRGGACARHARARKRGCASVQRVAPGAGAKGSGK
jgi:hypothetical protein